MKPYLTSLILALVVAGGPSWADECTYRICDAADLPSVLRMLDSEQRNAMIACGHFLGLDSESRDLVYKLQVFRCGTESPVLTFDKTVRLESDSAWDELKISELTRWNFGADWDWIRVPLWEYSVWIDADRPIEKRLVLSPPDLTEEQVEDVLREYRTTVSSSTPLYSGGLEILMGKTLAVALTGNEEGRLHLRNMIQELPLTGEVAERYAEAVEVYQSYATETGKVLPLPELEADAAGNVPPEQRRRLLGHPTGPQPLNSPRPTPKPSEPPPRQHDPEG
jgi:hypothetical protein